MRQYDETANKGRTADLNSGCASPCYKTTSGCVQLRTFPRRRNLPQCSCKSTTENRASVSTRAVTGWSSTETIMTAETLVSGGMLGIDRSFVGCYFVTSCVEGGNLTVSRTAALPPQVAALKFPRDGLESMRPTKSKYCG